MAVITSASISGFRGFGPCQEVRPGVPTEQRPGSGLTCLVGPNNGGKSSVLEAIHMASLRKTQTLQREERNEKTARQTEIIVTFADGKAHIARSNKTDKSRLDVVGDADDSGPYGVYYLLGRREFPRAFEGTGLEREVFVRGQPSAHTRTLDGQAWHKARAPKWTSDAFRDYLREISGFSLPIEVEQGQPAVLSGGHEHSPRLLGDGVAQAACIADALFDCGTETVTLIEEPESGLHPSLQRRIMRAFVEKAKQNQILIATHSPQFIDWGVLQNGGTLARVWRRDGEFAAIRQLSPDLVRQACALLVDRNNPHVLGAVASEVFFLSDCVILVEGQEDVVFYRGILQQLNLDVGGDFFGWGVGGASKMPLIARILSQLGYRRVVGILDADKERLRDELSAEFRSYNFFVTWTDDVRDKPDQNLHGLCSTDGKLKLEHKTRTVAMFEEIRDWLAEAPRPT